MMGLLGEGWDDPKSTAILQMASGLMSTRNPGMALSRGIQGYQQAMNDAEERKWTKQEREYLLKERQRKEEDALMTRGLLSTLFSPQQSAQAKTGDAYMPGAPEAGKTPQGGGLAGATPEQIALLKLRGLDVQSLWEKAKTGFKVDAGSWRQDPITNQLEYIADPTKGVGVSGGQIVELPKFAATNAAIKGAETDAVEGAKAMHDLVQVRGSGGDMQLVPRSQVVGQQPVPQGFAGLTPNQLQMIQADIAKNGNPNPTISPNWNYGNQQPQRFSVTPTDAERAAQGGREAFRTQADRGFAEELSASFKAANSAVSTVNTALTLQNIFDSGKIMAGPATKPEMIVAQVGEKLGIGGKDSAEKLANTRIAMQEMARAEMAAAQQMAGQGTITDFERTLIARASAGDLSMSLPELKALSQAIEKTARARIESHQDLLGRVTSDPQFADYGQRYSVKPPQGRPSKVINFSELK